MRGAIPSEQFGFVNTPIYRGSTVLQPTLAALEPRHSKRFTYGTHGTPTTEALEAAWSEIAGAAGTVLTPSGLAAISLALLTALKAGDHLLVTDSAYLPTRTFCNGFLSRMGVETTYYDPLVGAGIEALMRPNTKAVLVEAPGSQSFEMQDIPAIAEVAHARGACVIMDNTWATPLLFPPHERGVDLAIEAGTKYLSGHSDLLLGLVSANEAMAQALARNLRLFRHVRRAGGRVSGPARLAQHGFAPARGRAAGPRPGALARRAAGSVARAASRRWKHDPGHKIWKRDFLGSSGLFSVILKPAPEAGLAALLDGLELFGLGYSWGGYESLVIPFDCRDYRTATKWTPGRAGAALFGRSRRHRGSQGGSRQGLCADARSGLIVAGPGDSAFPRGVGSSASRCKREGDFAPRRNPRHRQRRAEAEKDAAAERRSDNARRRSAARRRRAAPAAGPTGRGAGQQAQRGGGGENRRGVAGGEARQHRLERKQIEMLRPERYRSVSGGPARPDA